MVVKTEKELSLCLCAVQRDWGEAEPLQTAVRTVVGQHSRLSRWWVTYSHLVLHNTAFNSRFSRVSHLSLWYSFFGYSHSLWAPQFKFLLAARGRHSVRFHTPTFLWLSAYITVVIFLLSIYTDYVAIMSFFSRRNWTKMKYVPSWRHHYGMNSQEKLGTSKKLDNDAHTPFAIENRCERKVTPNCFRVDTSDVHLHLQYARLWVRSAAATV